MNASREGGRILLELESGEALVLAHVLRAIKKEYAKSPLDLPPAEAAAWYGSRGCRSAGMSEEETLEWMRHLQQFRSGNLEHVTGWIARLESEFEGGCELELKLEVAPSFLTVINDHRLLMAARHDIGEGEMGLRMFQSLGKLSEPRQRALFEIELLAYLMETVLTAMPWGP